MSRDNVTQFVADPDVDAKRGRMKRKKVMSERSNLKGLSTDARGGNRVGIKVENSELPAWIVVSSMILSMRSKVWMPTIDFKRRYGGERVQTVYALQSGAPDV